MCVLSFSHVQLSATLWTVAHQTPLFMGFTKQKHWSEFPCPPPEDLPNPGIEPVFLMSPALAGGFFTSSATWEAQNIPGTERNRSLESATRRGCQYQIISLSVRANYFCPNSLLHLLHPRSQRWPSW